MLRTQHKRNTETQHLVDDPHVDVNLHEKDDNSKHRRIFLGPQGKPNVVLLMVVMIMIIIMTTILSLYSADIQSIGHRIKIQRSEFVLFLDFRDHTVTVVTKCDPKQSQGGTLYLWLEGDALLYIPLYQQYNQQQQQQQQQDQKEWSLWNKWHGMILNLPLEQGQYQLKSLWTGCKDEITYPEEDILLPFTMFERWNQDNHTYDNYDIFPQSNWIKWKVFMDSIGRNVSSTPQQQQQQEQEQTLLPSSISSSLLKENEYIWMDPQSKTASPIDEDNDSLVLWKEGSVKSDTEFFEFHKLSNYELVCWIGSDSATAYYSAFLSLRPHLFPHQRPFKFHLYPSYNFDQPDKTWGNDTSNDGMKQKFRKCKHILVSLDEPETPLSQCEYKEKVTNFIHHLEVAFPDTTFPIWIFTTLESPLHTTNCHSECMYLPRSTNHPCNDVLRDLFASHPFSSRVQLLDNTDISSSMPIRNKHMQFTMQYLVALRIFVIVGKKVKEWRMDQQEGLIDGLHRGTNVEPNFQLVAYNWTAKWDDFEKNPMD